MTVITFYFCKPIIFFVEFFRIFTYCRCWYTFIYLYMRWKTYKESYKSPSNFSLNLATSCNSRKDHLRRNRKAGLWRTLLHRRHNERGQNFSPFLWIYFRLKLVFYTLTRDLCFTIMTITSKCNFESDKKSNPLENTKRFYFKGKTDSEKYTILTIGYIFRGINGTGLFKRLHLDVNKSNVKIWHIVNTRESNKVLKYVIPFCVCMRTYTYVHM